MNADHPFWEVWAKTLRRWGMHGLAVLLLESAGPLTMLGAQMIYLSQPILRSIVPGSQISALASMLDNPAETQQFIVFLRERSVS